ncbi:hypothetical protein CGLO_09412 [Colletotrichum gloeosporioides Cg-14]|uniref:Uncharacterized protein n=1 Tax=Colletotrichum gloeosporioides (strain Cg-14) TaxID=1237896 RepID=T0KDW3_COLGC|nr:hypothetical protein CGLO_09412 [Colletotrichum gloeosporioides Cg-14]
MINDIAPYIRTMNITGNGAIVLRKASKWLCAIKY